VTASETINCPHCDKSYKIALTQLNKKATCGNCKKQFFINLDGTTQHLQTQDQTVPLQNKIKSKNADISSSTKDHTEEVPNDEKFTEHITSEISAFLCPNCFEETSQKSGACPNCGLTDFKIKSTSKYWLLVLPFLFFGILLFFIPNKTTESKPVPYSTIPGNKKTVQKPVKNSIQNKKQDISKVLEQKKLSPVKPKINNSIWNLDKLEDKTNQLKAYLLERSERINILYSFIDLHGNDHSIITNTLGWHLKSNLIVIPLLNSSTIKGDIFTSRHGPDTNLILYRLKFKKKLNIKNSEIYFNIYDCKKTDNKIWKILLSLKQYVKDVQYVPARIPGDSNILLYEILIDETSIQPFKFKIYSKYKLPLRSPVITSNNSILGIISKTLNSSPYQYECMMLPKSSLENERVSLVEEKKKIKYHAPNYSTIKYQMHLRFIQASNNEYIELSDKISSFVKNKLPIQTQKNLNLASKLLGVSLLGFHFC